MSLHRRRLGARQMTRQWIIDWKPIFGDWFVGVFFVLFLFFLWWQCFLMFSKGSIWLICKDKTVTWKLPFNFKAPIFFYLLLPFPFKSSRSLNLYVDRVWMHFYYSVCIDPSHPRQFKYHKIRRRFQLNCGYVLHVYKLNKWKNT